MDLSLKDAENKILWSGKDLCDSDTYRVSDEKLVTEKNRRAAIRKISEKIAQKVYQRLSWEQ